MSVVSFWPRVPILPGLRETPCQAVVIPGEDEVLLGALPLEGMDLTVNPLRNEVTGAHGDTIRIVVK
ncbi:MAG: hypothetical protein LBK43_08370 [Treponema sp.]|nr:hypothetical protein [Treponema sp.]